MKQERYFTKLELKNEVRKAYGRYLVAARIYNEMPEKTHTASFRYNEFASKKSRSISFTCYYRSYQKNDHFTYGELYKAMLDLMAVIDELYEDISEAAAVELGIN